MSENTEKWKYTAFTAILAAAIAAVSSLGGTLLANNTSNNTTKLQLAHEESRHLADLRRAAYGDFMVQAMDLNLELELTTRAEKFNIHSARKEVRAEYLAFVKHFTKILVLGSEESIEAAYAIVDAFSINTSRTKADIEKMQDTMSDRIGDFVDAIRPELRLSDPLQTLEVPPTS